MFNFGNCKFFTDGNDQFIGSYDMEDHSGVIYYKDPKTNNIIWQGCNQWRISNDTDHKGQCSKGELLNFIDGDINQKCIIGLDGDSKGKYGTEVYSGYSVKCKNDQCKFWLKMNQ